MRDVSASLDVAKSAVTTALKSLSEKGVVNYQPYEPVTVSAQGRRRAERIVLRHQVIRDSLRSVLDLSEQHADSVACGMEHAIGREALDRFVCFLVFVGRRRGRGGSWLKEFREFVGGEAVEKASEECMQRYLKSAGIQR